MWPMATGRVPEMIIYNGVDTKIFRPNNDLKLEGTPSILISASVYRLHKRFQEAVRLINAAAKEHQNIRLHVLGEFDPLVKEILPKLDISRCIFHGRVSIKQLPEFYSGADVLLSLSLFDPCPNVVCEGLACGNPVITPFESGASELVGDENRDWIVKEKLSLDYMPIHIYERIPKIPLNRYLDTLDNILEKLPWHKEKARTRAEDHLDIREKANEYTRFIQEVLKDSQSRLI